MQNFEFYGNKIMFLSKKEQFDSLTLEDLSNTDTAMTCKLRMYGYYCSKGDGVITDKSYFLDDLMFKNKDLSSASLCLNAIFGYAKFIFTKSYYRETISVGNTGYIIQFKDGNIILNYHKTPILLTTLGNSVLMDVGNQHWLTESNRANIIPFDKSVNNHTYTIEEIREDYIKARIKFFERGVGETKACGSGAFALGSYLYSIHNKPVHVITKNYNDLPSIVIENNKPVLIEIKDNEYIVTENCISVKY